MYLSTLTSKAFAFCFLQWSAMLAEAIPALSAENETAETLSLDGTPILTSPTHGSGVIVEKRGKIF